MSDYQYNFIGTGNCRYVNNHRQNMNCNNNCNQNCDCNCMPTLTSIPKPIKDCCCVNGIRKALLAIQCLVNKLQTPGTGIDLLITLESGVSYPISMINETENPILIGNDVITLNNQAISLCEIVKIQVLTTDPCDTIFSNLLLEELQEITTTCELAISRDNDHCCNNECCNIECEDTCCEKTDCCCAKGVQNYINSNKSTLSAIGYNGSFLELPVSTIVKDISTTTTTIPVIQSSTLSTSSTSVVNLVNTIPVSVVTTVPSVTTTVVSAVNNTNAVVSGPITTTPVTVVGNVTTVPQTLVTGITPTFSAFTSSSAVINFPSPTTASVLGGITSETIVSTVVETIPIITAATGGLFVVVGGVTTPLVDSTGAAVRISTPLTINTLASAANVLSIGGNPSLINVLTGLGTPTTISTLSGTANGATSVVTTITATTISGNLINTVTQTSINNVPPVPATVPVVNSVTTVNTPIQGLGTVVLSTISQTSTITFTTVISGATLTNVSTAVINDVVVTPTFVNSIIDVAPSTITILSPTTVPITGTISSVGNGILVVKETNGNITIYSVCDVNSIITM